MSLACEPMDAASTRPFEPDPGPSAGDQLDAAIQTACMRIAPLWPLTSFVAVNPFLGFSDLRFEAAAHELRRLTGARTLMPREFYRRAVDENRITPEDLAAATQEARASGLVMEPLLHAVARETPRRPPPRVATVAEVLDRLSCGDRQVSRTAFMIDEISKWCAAFFDTGQAAWAPPWRGLPLYAAWRYAMAHDRNPDAMGVAGFAAMIDALPEEPAAAIADVLRELEIPQPQWSDYLYRALHDIRGWAAYVRRFDWEAGLDGAPGTQLVDLLAVRVVWGLALFRGRTDPAFRTAWRAAITEASGLERPGIWTEAELAADLVLHLAYERGFQRRLIVALAEGRSVAATARPPLQAVFCIDVRSEVYRRALETVWPEAETFGFAGFFGMAMAHRAADGEVLNQCPVLLRPTFEVASAAPPPGPATWIQAPAKSLLTKLKSAAVSNFAFVEAFGLGYALSLAGRALALQRPGTDAAEPLDVPLDAETRLALAEGAFRGMGLGDRLARLVLLVGHGATTLNNPHAAGLDCGACGGHSGAPNARVAAALLNDPVVRAGLKARGIETPEDTWFAAALHDTTTDTLTLLDAESVPSTHAADIRQAAAFLKAASEAARAERAPRLGASQAAILARSRDWSQVRPEWGLAGAAAFIAAPRALTAGRDLEGRAFLHSYDRLADPDLKILELILIAPMIVASWISLQYYGSTVDNAAFGAGDKTLHNVCGRTGVLEGNAGDLRAGLPLQSVHDGTRFVHEPLRLSVFVAADPEAISGVLAAHPEVRTLLDNRWLHLFALNDAGQTTHRYAGELTWETLI